MDAKPDELVIALGSSHVARILEHLHEHAIHTDVDFEDVVPGLSGETCMKVWEKLKADASATSVTIKSQLPPVESTPASPGKNASQVLDSSPTSSAGIHESEHDDDSGTTIPRPRALVYDSDDSDDEGAGEGKDECDWMSTGSHTPFLAESDDESLSLQIARRARAALTGDVTKSPANSQTASQSGPPKTAMSADKSSTQTPVKGDGKRFDWMPGSLQLPISTPKQQTSKRVIDEGREGKASASLPFPVPKRPKTASARLASTPKLKSSSGCKHNICLGLNKCLVASTPAV